MIRSKLRNFIMSDQFPFFFLGLAMLVVHLLVPIPIGDDIDYSISDSFKWGWAAVVYRYNTWSAGVIPEAVVILLLKTPSILWRVLDSLVYVLLGVTISKLLVRKHKRVSNWFIAALLLIYPFREIANAGWVTTTVNYLWSLTFSLVALNLLRKIIHQEDFHPAEVLLSILLLLFAVNAEILCVLLTVIFLGASIYLLWKKRFHWFPGIGLLMCITSLGFIIASPGLAFRSVSELKWFPDFRHISLLTKLEMGMSSTLAHYVFNFSLLFLVFCILLFLVVKNKYPHWFYRAYAVIPLLIIILFGIIPGLIGWLSGFFNWTDIKIVDLAILQALKFPITKYGLISLDNFTLVRVYLVMILLYAAAGMLVISLIMAFGTRQRRLAALGILTLGLASRMAMSFSPTIWASGTRAFFLMSVSIILTSVMLFQELVDQKGVENVRGFLLSSGILAGLSYVHLLLTV